MYPAMVATVKAFYNYVAPHNALAHVRTGDIVGVRDYYLCGW
jgi:hypothetical protein